ncbi:hypothetical protein CH63R_02441 [Colletotrichum higginsianum IMI 349063]|uniref:Uncharacterized protein n=1 Tax=Colletotrichum higginsianum (strain IMI 349063) TaxID=759273 RepID=A0A1B7YNS6_COLHI|nr:hypothetical protein CH63R_02441 [Colletotrichum higginsianum IMI 349063]OBR13715.1 hypothetical protein CH63R_02441 [Colletotrichum higginsianum IMI 349063]
MISGSISLGCLEKLVHGHCKSAGHSGSPLKCRSMRGMALRGGKSDPSKSLPSYLFQEREREREKGGGFLRALCLPIQGTGVIRQKHGGNIPLTWMTPPRSHTRSGAGKGRHGLLYAICGLPAEWLCSPLPPGRQMPQLSPFWS